MQLNLPISINVDAVSAMIPIEGIKLKSDQLVDGGTRTNQGMNFRLFTGENLKAGSTLDLTISGITAASTTTTGKVKINPALFGAGVLLLAVSGVGLYFYQKQKVIKNVAGEATDANPGDKESIMDAIIVLDNLYKEGKLKEDIYTARREELKNQLKSSHVIQVRKLIKRFGPKTVLNQLSLQVADGEFVAILGPNGAGKTTFFAS